MPTYISLISFTDQGAARIGSTVERTRAACEAVRNMAGLVRVVLWTHGHYDQVAISEWPDEESALAFSHRLRLAGDVRVENLRAFEACDMNRILARLPRSLRSARLTTPGVVVPRA